MRDSKSNRDGQSTGEDDIIRMQVSSMHLTLVSPVFKAMLLGGFREGNKLRDSGSLEIPLPDDDYNALTILMDIIHCRLKKVPRRPDIETMTKLAILVDFYQLIETIQFFSGIWMEGKKAYIDLILAKGNWMELLQYLCFVRVFQHSESFKSISSNLVWKMESDISDVHTRNLPISDAVISKIQ